MADNTSQPDPRLTAFQLTDSQLDGLTYWAKELPFKLDRKFLLTKAGDKVNVLTNFEERITLK